MRRFTAAVILAATAALTAAVAAPAAATPLAGAAGIPCCEPR
ncbi:MAG: hypothetical protein ACJ74O_07275 [Frankiaceae bacterium]